MWSKRFLEWTDEKTKQSFLSVVFTWDLPKAYQRAAWLRQLGYHVSAGGPAVNLMPNYLSDIADVGDQCTDAIAWHNPLATFTSRGCIRRCSFCAVWQTEGVLRELKDWPIRPIVCDNNLLACSRAHFDKAIDRLKPLSGIDFNQGLDARLLTPYHAGRLAELDCLVRLAFDSVAYESQFMRAFETLRRASIPKKRIRVYVLVGFNDTPEDALYRLRMVADLGIDPNPMRYNPLDTLRRDSYVDPSWTASELIRYVRYWANLRYFRAVPFEEFQKRHAEKEPEQLAFT
jgi:hypothetical protein